jgi:hypothetical protein
MANLEEEDLVEDDSFRTVLAFPPEVQEAIDQASFYFIKANVVKSWSGRGRVKFVYDTTFVVSYSLRE